jgi:hypothetical protein
MKPDLVGLVAHHAMAGGLAERVSSAESEPSSSAWLERTWIIEARPIGVGAAPAHHGRDAEQRQVVALEDVG